MVYLYVLHDQKRDLYLCYENNKPMLVSNKAKAKRFGYADARRTSNFYSYLTIERDVALDDRIIANIE